MNRSIITRAAGAVALATLLTGCFDMDVDIEVLGADEALMTTTVVLDRNTFMMLQAGGGDSDFCGPTSEITEEADTVTCVDTERGSFAEVFDADEEDEPQPTVEAVSPGVYRIGLPTGEINDQLSMGGAGDNAQARAMIESLFAGRTMTVGITGKEILETNMELSEDGKTARLVISFDDVLAGTIEVPDESYAVVRVE